MICNHFLEAILNCVEKCFELECKLVLVVDYGLHYSQKVDSSGYKYPTVDVNPAIKHVYERIKHHTEVEFPAILGLLKHVEPEIVRCQCCHRHRHGHCGINIIHLANH